MSAPPTVTGGPDVCEEREGNLDVFGWPLSFSSLFQIPTVLSTTVMKVQTTVFVGNISEKASDTLVRQILLVSWCQNVTIFFKWILCSFFSVALWTD